VFFSSFSSCWFSWFVQVVRQMLTLVAQHNSPRPLRQPHQPTRVDRRENHPRAGSASSVLDHTALKTGVSLYYLTESFVSGAFIYAQNRNGFSAEHTKAVTDTPLLFSALKYNAGFWPPAKVAQAGNLVRYQSEFGLGSGADRMEYQGMDGFLSELDANFAGQITISAVIFPDWTTLLRLLRT